MISDSFHFALNSIKQRKLRSGLTIIGIIIGIASIVALISIGQGLQNYVNAEFEKLGTNSVTVSSSGAAGMGGAPGSGNILNSPLTEKDMETIEKVPGVEGVAGILIKAGKVTYKDETKFLYVVGVPTDEKTKRIFNTLEPIVTEYGRDLRDSDVYNSVVRYGVIHDVFEKEINLKDRILINGQEFTVVGSIAKIGNSFADSIIMIPMETARKMYNEPELIDQIMINVKNADAKTVEDIKDALRKSRNEKEGEETFQVQTSEDLRKTFGSILSVITIVLVGIASISLLVGGIGIMNSMYTNVLERTREIGIMKAIGAKNSHVLLIFLIEAGIFGLAGGVIGASLGTGLALAVGNIASSLGYSFLVIKANYFLLIGALSFSFIIGCISGILPAIRASKLKPVEALRYE